jgi:hypothetical protein
MGTHRASENNRKRQKRHLKNILTRERAQAKKAASKR